MKEALEIKPQDIEMTVDNKGIPCALGIFKVMREMGRIAPGRVLEIFNTDRSSTRDLAKWTDRVGHRILAVHQEGNALRPWWRIYIRKKSSSTEV